MQKKTIRDIEVGGKRVLVRVDFNVPQRLDTSEISDDTRIRASLPTIRYLIEHKAKVILCSHLGRPEGKVDEKLRIGPVARRLSELMNLPVLVAPDCVGPEVREKVSRLKEGDILFLENVRFHPEEQFNDPRFAQELARLADIYVDDAFGTAHRVHASTVGVAKYLPAVAGFLMEKELDTMGKLLSNPSRPFACAIGGAKISDKMGLVRNMLRRVDLLLLGGGMAATFLKGQGYEVGHSLVLVEKDKLALAKDLLQEAEELKVPVLLPIDVMVAEEIKADSQTKVVAVTDIPPNSSIVDIGPKSIDYFFGELEKCRTITWNGPMGVYEIPRFAQGTKSLINYLSSVGATIVIGGGSSAEAVQEMGLTETITHVSTGGGATLRFLQGAPLPGVEALLDKTGGAGGKRRIPLIAGNWKMNTTLTEAKRLVRDMSDELDRIEGVKTVLCPPFVSLTSIKELLKGSSIKLGAQNMYFEEKGAYTGEISPPMLAELCEFVILGHSERRRYFGETDQSVNKKMMSALTNRLKPILCVGENLAEKEAGKTDEVITRQVSEGLNNVKPTSDIVIAYEPIWAIGTGKAASSAQAAATIGRIRDIVAGLWGKNTADDLRILYGGSVTRSNISDFISQPEIDGALVGGASLKPGEFLGIVEQAATVKKAAA
ncbi:MAG: triose-phosphate isomerase [Chloroflexota bacterium]|nr:triose-phosphate isomerase [Chloroflexota bacterium]